MNDQRSPEQLWQHYTVEKELANRLRNASATERRALYRTVYDELFRRVPNHPCLKRKCSAAAREREVMRQLSLISRYLLKDTCFLEIGPGDCSLSFRVAKIVSKVLAVDVSRELSANVSWPENFSLFLTDGVEIPVPPSSVSFAYSNHLMEHLHPDDAFDQLKHIHRALGRGGLYLCVTPYSMCGPSDISKYYDDSPTGFHLKEYSYQDIYEVFSKAGFAKLRFMLGVKEAFVQIPANVVFAMEKVILAMPMRSRRVMLRSRLFSFTSSIRVLAEKTGA